jgi:hypothetical protein
MDRLSQAKLALLVMAAIFIAGGVRMGVDWPVWVAIGLLVVALLLRAVGKRRSPPDETDASE